MEAICTKHTFVVYGWILPIDDSIDAPKEDLFGAEIVNENSL